MTEHKVQITMENVDTGTNELPQGLLPQGSPASPILYALYTVPIHAKDRDPLVTRFSYADDYAILVRGSNLEDTGAKAQILLDRLVA